MSKDLYCIVIEDNGIFDVTENEDGFIFMTRDAAEAELLLYDGSILSSFKPKLAKLTFVKEKK